MDILFGLFVVLLLDRFCVCVCVCFVCLFFVCFFVVFFVCLFFGGGGVVLGCLSF